jgi:hypothetical protein
VVWALMAGVISRLVIKYSAMKLRRRRDICRITRYMNRTHGYLDAHRMVCRLLAMELVVWKKVLAILSAL